MCDFPRLQGEATTGKSKLWSIRVFERLGTGVIEVSHGYLDGKIQTTEKIISVGKNIGKKNETTPLQQAISEAKAAWTKKIESGYSETMLANSFDCDAFEQESDEEPTVSRGKGVSAEAPFPMLAHDYHKRGKASAFPCFTQRKLDGTRCIAIPQKGLFSRLRKTFPHMEHIKEEIDMLSEIVPTIILDGELYSTSLTFQEIVGLVKRETLKKGDAEKQLQIKYHVYDIIMEDKTYEERYQALQEIFDNYTFEHLVLVQTDMCGSEEQMKEQHAQYVAEGYEGIMLRTKKGLYKNSRSVDLLKYKEFFDDEYEVVGFEQGTGLEDGSVIWVCVTPEGKTFNCRPRGTREDRQRLYENGDLYIGKKLTVRYQELTDEKVPRFPVGITFRDYE